MRDLNSKLLRFLEVNLLIQANNEQKNALEIISNLLRPSFLDIGFFNFFFSSSLGIFLHGPVGAGKSVLVKAIFNVIEKSRISSFHYNEFIIILQQRDFFHVEELSRKIVIVDELQINNLADAILIFKFLKAAEKKKQFIIFTSNRSPCSLYKSLINEQLMTQLNLHLKNKFNIIKFKSKIDYRMNLEMSNSFFFHDEKDNIVQQNILVKKICGNSKMKFNNIIKESTLLVKVNTNKKLIDCSFNEICGSNLGTKEYKEIVNKFDFIILRSIPLLVEEKKDMISRFIIFVDHIYENKKFLSISSIHKIEQIFKAKTNFFEFKRTFSRLNEIGSKIYVTKFLEKILK